MPLSIPQVAPGQRAPHFNARALQGGLVSLYDLFTKGPVALVFYRGGWCPLCSVQINSLSLEYAQFEAQRLNLVAISNEPMTQGADVLAKYSPAFPIVYDENSQIIKRYGLQNPAAPPPSIPPDYAHPSVILIDREGVIRWSYVGENPKDRPSTSEILAAAEQFL